MKTKLALMVLLLMTIASYAQINIQERAVNYNYTTPKIKFDDDFKKSISAGKDSARIGEIDKVLSNNESDYVKFSQLLEIDSTLNNILINKSEEKSHPILHKFYLNKKELLKKELRSLNEIQEDAKLDADSLIKLIPKIDAKLEEIRINDSILKVIEKKVNDANRESLWFPSKTDTREKFYDNLYSKDSKNLYLLNNLNTQIGTNSSAVSTELISAYMRMVRVSFGTLMTNSKTTETNPPAARLASAEASAEADTQSDDAFQRLLSSGGGNIFLNFEFPICYAQSTTATFLLNSNGKVGTTVKEFSRDVDTAAGSGNISLNAYGSIATDDNKSFIFFFNSSIGGFGGGTEFYNNLNLSKNGVFAFSQLTFGLDIAKAIRITYTAQTFGSDESLRSQRGVVGVQLLKGLFD